MVSMNMQEVCHLKNKEVGGRGQWGGRGGLTHNGVTVAFYDWQVLWDQNTPQPDRGRKAQRCSSALSLCQITAIKTMAHIT